VKVIAHQAGAVPPEGITHLGLGQRRAKRLQIGVVNEDAGAVVAAVERVANQAIAKESRKPAHGANEVPLQPADKGKNERTPIFPRSNRPTRGKMNGHLFSQA
jgi:hypothetical protein